VGVNIPDISLSHLDFSVRTRNCLKKSDIGTLGELEQFSEDNLLSIRNFGETSLYEVKNKMANFGLFLKRSTKYHRRPETREELTLLRMYGEEEWQLHLKKNLSKT